jgi:hypothetical protein
MRYEIEQQQLVTNEAENRINAVQTARDMLQSWRRRMGISGTISHTYTLPRQDSLELTSADEDHVTASHTTPDQRTTYEFDATTGHLVVDIEPAGGQQVPGNVQAVMLYDDLGRLLFEADVQERGH